MMVDALREKIKELFTEKKVDMVIGWGKGSMPLSSTPMFINRPEEADQLIFDETCQNNLAVYLTKDKRRLTKNGNKIGIVAKGCDGRSLVLYVIEKQIQRENIVIIGVPCSGVIDKNKVLEKTGGREVLSSQTDGDSILLKGKDFEISVQKTDVLSNACLSCTIPNAPETDVFIGDPVEISTDKNPFQDVETFEKLSSEERWKAMTEAYSKCVRCYACRNVCPSCYCSECFVDQNDPQWIGKSPEMTDTLIFHLIRNLHVAGRCVECGACERACPEGIDLLLLNKKISKEIKERFDYTAGTDIHEKPAFASYCENEKQDFIMG